MSQECVFCAILRGESPASFTYQDDSVVAFMDVQPITHGHMLVVPREHAVLMADVSETAAARTFRVARKLSSVVRHTLGASGVNLFVADGEVAFQDVPHFHVHVIPRYPKDGFGLTFPHTYEHPPARAQLDAIANAIRAGVPATA
ncbi:MAG TPA: HIT domain-containing protein [Candidatus Dormibacteraeota bacterium]|jgi:diadenosine tetraphosphate (Ap4A) HIT family hydrolase|nr:HIT domain-containing protein [Candidatus Dormibacteraeota bacterium]HEX2680641.1 HIT domain-containing protein [Candidatus Dormibacteraeota bacterium]